MKILGIETSCDETALAIVEADGGLSHPHFKVISEAINSQTKIHEKYGGVYPMMAKREHSKNLVPLLKDLLKGFQLEKPRDLKIENEEEIKKILERETELLQQFLEVIPTIPKPDIDVIAVTVGPGLEPALWVGVNFARALGLVWDLLVLPINHMEGHILSVLLDQSQPVTFPALALLISGGHTELVLMRDWQQYEILGRTRDDAVGEAFDKVARMLELPYPGGPEISKLAEKARTSERSNHQITKLPRPMLNSPDYDFSFSGLKTAVLYRIREMSQAEKLLPFWKEELAQEFEDAVTEVLIYKTKKAIEEFNIKTLIVGGGVIANSHLRQEFQKLIKEGGETKLLTPQPSLSTDNAVMIAMAGYFKSLNDHKPVLDFRATGNLSLQQDSL